MTSDDFTFITLRGELRTKEEILQEFASGSFKYESWEISDLNARVCGDSAIVTGRSVSERGPRMGRISPYLRTYPVVRDTRKGRRFEAATFLRSDQQV